MTELDRLLKQKDPNVEFYCDTTFNLGDFYVLALVFRHPIYQIKPIIPIVFVLHERKFQTCYISCELYLRATETDRGV